MGHGHHNQMDERREDKQEGCEEAEEDGSNGNGSNGNGSNGNGSNGNGSNGNGSGNDGTRSRSGGVIFPIAVRAAPMGVPGAPAAAAAAAAAVNASAQPRSLGAYQAASAAAAAAAGGSAPGHQPGVPAQQQQQQQQQYASLEHAIAQQANYGAAAQHLLSTSVLSSFRHQLQLQQLQHIQAVVAATAAAAVQYGGMGAIGGSTVPSSFPVAAACAHGAFSQYVSPSGTRVTQRHPVVSAGNVAAAGQLPEQQLLPQVPVVQLPVLSVLPPVTEAQGASSLDSLALAAEAASAERLQE